MLNATRHAQAFRPAQRIFSQSFFAGPDSLLLPLLIQFGSICDRAVLVSLIHFAFFGKSGKKKLHRTVFVSSIPAQSILFGRFRIDPVWPESISFGLNRSYFAWIDPIRRLNKTVSKKYYSANESILFGEPTEGIWNESILFGRSGEEIRRKSVKCNLHTWNTTFAMIWGRFLYKSLNKLSLFGHESILFGQVGWIRPFRSGWIRRNRKSWVCQEHRVLHGNA